MNDNLFGFLPPPRLPSRPQMPAADLIEQLAGEKHAAPLRAAETATRAARDALETLEQCRPGPLGKLWREALDADAATHAAGREPRKYATATLIEGDAHRWVHARVLCGAVPAAWAKAKAELNMPAIEKAAMRATTQNLKGFEKEVRAGWKMRNDKSAAWSHYEAARQHVAEHERIAPVTLWAAGDGYLQTHIAAPGGAEVRGMWMCLGWVLEPTENRLLGALPNDVVWPAGADELVAKAFGRPATWLALSHGGVVSHKEASA